MTDNKPVHTLTYGTVRVRIWANSTPLGVFCNVVPSRSYKKDENWRDSNSFGEFDLPLLAKAVLDAHSWIQTHKAAPEEVIALPPPPALGDHEPGTDAHASQPVRLPGMKP